MSDTTQKTKNETISEDKTKECFELKKKANKNLGLTLTMVLLIPILYIFTFLLLFVAISPLVRALVFLFFYVGLADLIVMFFVYGIGAIIYGIKYRNKNCHKIK